MLLLTIVCETNAKTTVTKNRPKFLCNFGKTYGDLCRWIIGAPNSTEIVVHVNKGKEWHPKNSDAAFDWDTEHQQVEFMWKTDKTLRCYEQGLMVHIYCLQDPISAWLIKKTPFVFFYVVRCSSESLMQSLPTRFDCFFSNPFLFTH